MYSAFIRLHPAPVWLTDLKTLRIVDINQSASDLFGKDHPAQPAFGIEFVSEPEDLPHLHAQLDRVRHNEPFSAVCRLKKHAFGTADILVSWLPVVIEQRGHALAILHFDISLHRSRNEARLGVRTFGGFAGVPEQAGPPALRVNSKNLEALSQLTGGIAHDFNNLLTVIIGNAELLAEDPEIAPRHGRMAKTVILAAERGSRLTSQLLSFAREQALVPHRADLNLLLKRTEPGLRRALSEGQTLCIVAGPDLWVTDVDPDQFEINVLALVDNAIDAMPPDGTLTIETCNHQAAAAAAREAA